MLAVALALTMVSPAGASKMKPAMSGKLAAALTAAKAETNAPGVIAGVWIGNRSWTVTNGTTSRGGSTRPTLAAHTRIGSVTKTFTGTVILQLVSEGKIRLDESIDRWFPKARNAGSISVRDLGTMASGIDSYTANASIVNQYLTRPRTVWKQSTLINAGLGMPQKFTPGDGFQYSNTNFVMLGRIIEKITHKPLATVFRNRIFRPLGMKQSSYPATPKLPVPYWNGDTTQGATGDNIRNATHWSPTFEAAAGQIVSTLSDMGRYTRALGTGSLITPRLQQVRLKPNPASVAGGREYDFALGTDHGWLAHSGEVPGYNSQVGYLPSKKAAIVIFTNTDIANPDGASPASSLFTALAKVVSPKYVPTGAH